MPVKETSLLTWIGINESGEARTQRGRIYLTIERNPLRTRMELSSMLNIPIQAICGRVNELIKNNAINEYPRRECNVTGAQANTLGV